MTELNGPKEFTVEAFFEDCRIDTIAVEKELDAFLECHTENGVPVGTGAVFDLFRDLLHGFSIALCGGCCSNARNYAVDR